MKKIIIFNLFVERYEIGRLIVACSDETLRYVIRGFLHPHWALMAALHRDIRTRINEVYQFSLSIVRHGCIQMLTVDVNRRNRLRVTMTSYEHVVRGKRWHNSSRQLSRGLFFLSQLYIYIFINKITINKIIKRKLRQLIDY